MPDQPTREQRVDAYLQRIVQGDDFPAFSAQVREVMSVLEREDASMHLLANIVLKNYSLMLRVLRTANTFHYNRSGTRILSVTQAMVLLGVKNVRHLAGSLILLEHYQKQSPSLRELMLLSLLTATHARILALRMGYPRPEEAHLFGMCSNLGEVLVACHCPADYAAILSRVKTTHEPIGEAARAVLGFRFDLLGDAVIRYWGLDVPSGASKDDLEILDTIVACSHELTTTIYRHDGRDPEATVNSVLRRYGSKLDLSTEAVRSIVDAGVVETREVFTTLDASIDDLKLRRQIEVALGGAQAGPRVEVEAEGSTPVDAPGSEERRQRFVSEIEAAIDTDPFEFNDVLLMILEAAYRDGPFDHAVLCLMKADRTEVAGRFGFGEDVQPFSERLRFLLSLSSTAAPAGPSLLRKVDLLVASDRNPSEAEASFLDALGAYSVGLFPIVVEQKLLGALYLDRTGPPSPDVLAVTFVGRLREALNKAFARSGSSRAAPARKGPIAPEVKYEIVLRALRGESVEAMGREIGVDAGEIQEWQRSFLAGAISRLKNEEPRP